MTNKIVERQITDRQEQQAEKQNQENLQIIEQLIAEADKMMLFIFYILYTLLVLQIVETYPLPSSSKLVKEHGHIGKFDVYELDSYSK